MQCPVCCNKMNVNIRRSLEPGNMYTEETRSCECGYSEFITSYGVHTVSVGGCEIECGDPTTIAGNLAAWKVWYAIQEAKEGVHHDSND